jgi:dolichol-phosphate hexosyltransferase
MLKVSAVIPCYNEEESVGDVIDGVPKEIHEIIVVDNNCTDNTAKISQEKGARVVPEPRAGYGYALQGGFAAATGDVIVTLDGDNQYPAHDIMKAAEYMEANGLDFLNCSRFPLDNKDSMPFVRRFGNAFFNVYTNLLFGTKFTDSWSGMMCFRKSILPLLALESGDMPLSQEMKIKAVYHPEIKFGEMHIGYIPRKGKSKLAPFRHGFMMLGYGIDLRRRIKRSEYKRA